MPASVKRSSAAVARTSGCQAVIAPVTKGGGKGVNKRRQSRYEGEGVKEGASGSLGRGRGRSRKGRRWEERKGGRGKGEVVAGRERESDAEVVEMPGEQRREKNGMGREDVKEEDMKAIAKWNGRQGQSRMK
ncbi:hypothetical protein B0H14DRAFT_3124844 [Mycena olivaceomarginata]|nr:hypothetical protein B0H14DRAFT_3124844 [Mycena olivaceomarginata]